MRTKICCIYNSELYERYKKGIYPSHHIYGVAEIAKAGYDIKMINVRRPWKNLWNILCEKPDIIYIPFLRRREYKYLFIAKKLHVVRAKIMGINHITQIHGTVISKLFTRFVFSAVDMNFFLSPLNLQESVEEQLMQKNRCLLLNWGPDLDFYDKHCVISTGEEYVSTGKEYRDYKTLIHAFQNNDNLKLAIYTCSYHVGTDYTSFEGKRYGNNIKFKIVNNDEMSFCELARLSAKSKAIVIPILKEHLDYCIGLSSIADSLALGKAIMVTNNRYHPINVEELRCGCLFAPGNVQDWQKLADLSSDEIVEMGKNALKLGRERFNMNICGKQIVDVIKNIIDEDSSSYTLQSSK